MLSQNYPHIEVIVQDCSSTDGTLDILQSYGKRIDLAVVPDTEPIAGLCKAIQRSKGEIFITSTANEILLPSAVLWGVEQLDHHPHAGALYGDRYVTDIEGNITGIDNSTKWNYKQLLCSEMTPPLSTSFIRRSAYDSIGPIDPNDFSEFELWVLLGLRFPVCYVPGPVSQTAAPNQRLSLQIEALEQQTACKFRAIKRFFNRSDLPVGYNSLKKDVLASMHTWIVNGYCNINAWERACSAFHLAYTKESNMDRLHYAGMRLLNHGLFLIKEGRIRDARKFIELPLKMPKAFVHIDLNPVRNIYDHFYPVRTSANYMH